MHAGYRKSSVVTNRNTQARSAITHDATSAIANTEATKSEAIPAVTSITVRTRGGTANYLSKFNSSSVAANSVVYDNGTDVGLGIIPNGNAKLDVNGPMMMRGNMTVSRTGNATATKG